MTARYMPLRAGREPRHVRPWPTAFSELFYCQKAMPRALATGRDVPKSDNPWPLHSVKWPSYARISPLRRPMSRARCLGDTSHHRSFAVLAANGPSSYPWHGHGAVIWEGPEGNMDLLRFIVSLPLRFLRALFRLLGKAAKPIFGDMAWSAP